MFGLRARMVQAFCCLIFAIPAHAYIETPFLNPLEPHAAQDLFVNVDSGVCDAIADEVGYPQVTQDGSSIRVVLLAFRFTDIENCNLPSGLSKIPIGAFAAGRYEVTVDVFYYDEHGVPQEETIGVLPLRVRAVSSNAVAAPATSPLGLILLAMLFVAAAFSKQRVAAA